MSDTQPLISHDMSLLCENDKCGQKPRSVRKITTWFRRFFRKQSDDDYERFDDDVHGNDEIPIGFFQLFRFADWIDRIMLMIGLCCTLLYACMYLTYIIIFGRITNTFMSQTSPGTCDYQSNSSSINVHEKDCPLGINLNSFNYAQMQKFCNYNGNITSPMRLSSMTVLRANIMTEVYWLLIVGTVALLTMGLRNFILELAAKRQTSRIRIRLFQAILQRNISYFDTKPTGQLNAKLFDNIDKLELGIGFHLSIVIAVLIGTISSVIIALTIKWELTLIMLCTLPLAQVATHIFSKVMANETMNEFNSYSKAGHIVQEVFNSLRTVLSLNGSNFEQKRYERELDNTYWCSIRKGAISGAFAGWLYFLRYSMYAAGFFFAFLIMHHQEHEKMNIGDVLIIVISFAESISWIATIAPFLQTCAEARGTATTVFRLISETDESNAVEIESWIDNVLEQTAINIDGDIHFDNVSFLYPARNDVFILQNLTLMARAGKTTAIIGSSGCGKSTCISLLLRYYDPFSGRITINGQSITEYNVQLFRKHIGVVSQEPFLFSISIYENIRYGNENASRSEIEEAARQANAHTFIMRLPDKYETLVGEHGIQLSGGEKQLVALARALVKQPTLLFLDEATSALDNVSEKLVQEALNRACQDRTTIVIAHRLSTIRNAHYIYVLDKGSVVEQGTHQTLMEQGGKYRALVDAQHTGTMENEENDKMSEAEVENQVEKQFLERTHLLWSNKAGDVNQKGTSSSNQQYVFLRLLAMNSPEWIFLLTGCLACIAIGASQSLHAFLFSKIVQVLHRCTYREQYHQVIILSCFFLLLGLATVLIRFFQFGSFAISGAKLTKRIRVKAFAYLLRQEVSYFDQSENSPGSICARLSSDASAVQQMIGTRLGNVIETVVMFALAILLGWSFSSQLTLMASLFIFLIFVMAAVTIVSEAQLKERNDLLLERASSIAVEAIHNMRTVKQLTIEKEILRQYTELIHGTLTNYRNYLYISALTLAITWSLPMYILAALFTLALILVEHNQLEPHNIIIILAFVIFTTQSIHVFLATSKEIGASLSAARSFFRLFDRTPTIDNGSTEGKQLMDFRGEIQFDQVKFAYPSRPASVVLNNFRLIIRPGQRVALVGRSQPSNIYLVNTFMSIGASGCGKSTVIQLIERFYDVSHGQLLLDGVDIRQLDIHWIRSRLGFVNQEPALFDLTIAENITYGLENISQESIIEAAIKANIHPFIQQLPEGYDTKVGQKGSRLSGGEKQRIAIARAVLRRPKILLLDEATSAMDSQNEQIVQEALEQAQNEDSSRTLLIIAHRLSTIRSCDLICVLDRGCILESGTHTELIQRRGIFYQMLNQNSS